MKMKKVSALVLAGALLTMGGVYATWSFADGTAESAEMTLGFNIAGVAGSTAKGLYTAGNTSARFLVVNQFGSNFFKTNFADEYEANKADTDDHTAWLTANPSDEAKLTFTFTPGDDVVDTNVLNYGIESTLTFSLVNNVTFTVDEATHQYKADGTAKNVFAITTAIFDILPYTGTDDGEARWSRSATAPYVFTYEFYARDLTDHIAMGYDFIIKDKAAYEAFTAKVVGEGLKVQITEKVTTPTT